MSLALNRGMARKFQIGPKELTQPRARALARRSSSRPSIELQHSLPGQIAAISSSVDMVMSFVSKFRKVDGSEANIEMALHEALTNAVVHGSHEDPDKRVYVLCRCSVDGEVLLTIRDQGQGFDSSAIPDPTAEENLLSTHGRGIYLMHTLMDEVSFDEGGVVVRMRKKANAGSGAERRPE